MKIWGLDSNNKNFLIFYVLNYIKNTDVYMLPDYALQLLMSSLTSFIVGILVHKYIKARNDKIKRKVEDVDSSEEFVIKLSKSTLKLQRTTFITILSSITLIMAALFMIFTALAFRIPESGMQYLYAFSAFFVFLGGGICINQAQAIIDSSNVTRAKERFAKKREKLSNKLD